MTESAQSDAVTSKRVPAIDGIRGIAALMVLLHHLSLTNNWYASRINVMSTTPLYLFPERPWTSVQTFVEWSPLHMVYASNAIFIFFVVSGFILVNPVRKFTTRSYALGRLTRLYVPIIAASIPAVLFAFFYENHLKATTSYWLNLHLANMHWSDVIGIQWLLDGHLQLNPVLWTMTYEVLFSLGLPALLWKVSDPALGSRRHYIRLAGFISLSCLGAFLGFDFMTYLPVFFVGVVLTEIPPLRRGHVATLVLGVVLMNLVWTVGGFHYRLDRVTFTGSTLIGAALVVHSVRGLGLPSRFLATAYVQFLGRRSFSIYLLHVPIIMFVWLSLPFGSGTGGNIERYVCAVVLIFTLVEIFYRLVERRAQAWSHVARQTR